MGKTREKKQIDWGGREKDLPGTPLHGLSVEDLYGTTGSRVDLVIHHVLETLVVGRAEEDLGIQLATGVSVVEHLRTNLRHDQNDIVST